MAEKILKSTDDASLKKKKRKKATADDELIDNVYKMNFEQDDLDLTSRKVKELQDTQIQMKEALLSLQNAQQNLEENDSSQVALKEQSVLQQEQVDSEIAQENKSTKKTANSRKKSNKNIIKVVNDDEDDDIDDIFGNVNKWLTDDDLEETIKEQKSKARKKRLTKIEEGIKSSKKSKSAKESTDKTTKTNKRRTKKQIEEEQAINNIADFANVTNTTNTDDMTMSRIQTNQDDAQGEIKIHAENDVTEILLGHNQYKIELQKLEYNIYTEKNETSYIIVRDSGLRIVSGNDYLFLQKQGEDYEVTTNQDFKINYVIDNLARKDKL